MGQVRADKRLLSEILHNTFLPHGGGVYFPNEHSISFLTDYKGKGDGGGKQGGGLL